MTRWSWIGALGLVLAATAGFYAMHDDSSGHVGLGRYRDGRGRVGRGGAVLSAAAAAPSTFDFTEADMGAACACANPSARYGTTTVQMTSSRSTSAWCTADDYSLVLCAANQPRFMRGSGPSSPVTFFSEALGQNDLRWNRDLSNAVWTKSVSMVCAKTATGVDGTASAASHCAASAADQTVTQADTFQPSSPNSTSLYLRRTAGTGAVSVTRDGSTWYDVSGSLTADYKRVVCIPIEGCMGGRCIVVADLCATSLHPTVGLKIATSGDAVDTDMWQNEVLPGTKPTSPMNTTSGNNSRGADSAYFVLPTPLAHVASFSVSAFSSHLDNNVCVAGTWAANNNFVIAWNNGTLDTSARQIGCALNAPTGSLVGTGGATAPEGGYYNVSCSQYATTVRGCMTGQCSQPSYNLGLTVVDQTRIYLPCNNLSAQFSGLIGNICVDANDPERCGPTHTTVLPVATHFLMVGDSITNGSVSAPTRVPNEIYRLKEAANSKFVLNAGVAGDNAAGMLARWNAGLKTQGFGSLIVLGGVNDLRGGTSAAATFVSLQAIYDDALARGIAVYPVYLTPWKNWSEWTAGKQTQTDALDVLLQAYCDAHVGFATCIDARSALWDAADHSALDASYDSGDGLHPNAAGSTALATAIAAVLP